jgi:hypothetical protein
MGTRGFITFVADGVEKTAYNQFDSYPEGVGSSVLVWLRFAAQDLEDLRERVKALRVVSRESTPTDEDVKRLAAFADLRVSYQDPREWYVLLRETQGSPATMLQAGMIEDASQFPADSLFAEWGYVIDLDKRVFEVYRGFQQAPHDKGRFAKMQLARRGGSVDPYYPVALVESWPIETLPNNEKFLSALTGDDE